MAVPIVDIRVDWRGDGFSTITNDSFVTTASGWAITAGINAAGTSITRVTGDGALGGVTTNTCGELVTTAVSGSGTNYDFGTTSFTIGRTYRFRVWLKSVSGTTSAKILIGSLGTVGDRASSTMTITTSWVSYQVDWTPSGTRTDVEANITNNAASIMTARICMGEVFETFDDITPDAMSPDGGTLVYGRGASFDGSAEAPGTATVRLVNLDQKYSPDNGASPLTGLIRPGVKLWVRASYANLVYALFYGTVRRVVLQPAMVGTIELMAEDPLFDFGRAETNSAVLSTLNISDFRLTVLADIGVVFPHRAVATAGPEALVPYTWADQHNCLALLSELNDGTGTVHWIKPHPSASVEWQYTTVDRTQFQNGASSETYDDDLTALSAYDLTDDTIVNHQRVVVDGLVLGATATLWTSTAVPFVVPAGSTVTVWASFDLALGADVSVTASNSPVVAQTPYGRSVRIDITAGAAATVSAVTVSGRPLTAADGQSVRSVDSTSQTSYGVRAGSDIETRFIQTVTAAQSLADWWTYRYADPKARPSVTYQNRFPSQVTREIADRVSLNFALLTIAAKEYLIRSFTTTVLPGKWITTSVLEQAPTAQLLFTIGGSAAQGVGGTGILAR